MQTLILLLLFSQISLAEPPPQPAPTPYTFNYYNQTPPPPNPAEACIGDICGPPAQSNLFMTRYLDAFAEFYARAVSPENPVDYSPELSKLFSGIMGEYDHQLKMMIDKLRASAPSPAPMNGMSKAVYNFNRVKPFINEFKYKITTTNGKTKAIVDEEASAATLKKYSPQDRELAVQTANFYASRDHSSIDVDSQPVNLALKARHSGAPVQKAMEAELVQAQKSAASLKGAAPLEQMMFFNDTSPEKIALIAAHVKDGSLTENEAREILQFNDNFKNLDDLTKSPESPLVKTAAPPLEDIIKSVGGKDGVSKIFSSYDSQNRLENQNKIAACKAVYFLNKRLLPNNDQLNTLKQDIARSKQLVKETIKAKFPPSLQQKLIHAVDETDFIMPPSAADFERNFTQSIQSKLQAARRQTTEYGKLSPDDVRQLSPMIIAFSTKDSQPDTSNEYCDAFNFSPLSDASYGAYGSILVSYTTATVDESARMHIIMHELGHVVSKAADDAGGAEHILGARTCLTDEHTEALPHNTNEAFKNWRAADPKTPGPYSEEDFADAVSIAAGKTVKGRNPWCQLLTLTYDRQQYSESTLQAQDDDSHSADLFRLFGAEISRKGHLPESCTNYLKTVKFTDRFSPCLDLIQPQGTASSPDGAIK